MKNLTRFHKYAREIRKITLLYPETTEEFLDGHSAYKVNGKSFLLLDCTEDVLSVSLKLPESAPTALKLLISQPTEFGLGISGWVTATFPVKAHVPMEILRHWIDESYRAVAPKRLVSRLRQHLKTDSQITA